MSASAAAIRSALSAPRPALAAKVYAVSRAHCTRSSADRSAWGTGMLRSGSWRRVICISAGAPGEGRHVMVEQRHPCDEHGIVLGEVGAVRDRRRPLHGLGAPGPGDRDEVV